MRARPVVAVMLAAMALGGALGAYLPFTALDGAANDAAAATRQALFQPTGLSDAQVALVLLDERSVMSDRLSAMPRALMSPIWSAVAKTALAHGALGVGFDFILAFDSAAFRLGEEAPLARHDDGFLRLLRAEGRAGRLVIGRSGALTPARRFALMAGPKGVAHVDIDTDPDGVVRRVRDAFTTADGATAPTLTGALTGRAAGEEIPITPPGPLSDFPAVGVSALLDCVDAKGDAALDAFFGGRVVFVGGALPGEDRFRAADRFMDRGAPSAAGAPCALTPPEIVGPRGDLPGVYLHAAAVDARLSGWAPAPAGGLAAGLAAALAAGLAALAGMLTRPGSAAAAALGVGLVGFAGAAAAQEAGVLLPAIRPGLAALVGFGAGWAGRLFLLDRRAAALRASFARYLAPELIDRMLSQEKLPDLEGETREVAVMFADLSGFTALSEQVDGKTLTATVNKYLSIIAAEVERSGGYVDKFIGDAVMAIWNAPVALAGYERAAVLAAAAIRDRVAEAALDDRARGLPAFSVKIGLHSGSAVLGNVGSERRMNYTAVGDTVNIAARMEGLPSVFQTPIILGETCARAAEADFEMLEIASIQVKGRREPVRIFAPLPVGDAAGHEEYAAALAAYRAGAFDEAGMTWRALARDDWPGAPVAAVMAEFSATAATDPPGPDWSGAVVMRTK
ncbi:CHASE2 domain-containing protein [Pikeienuella piscinae]|uniref:CHASE2 domain-containing protein n=1 Tax=Pikeienuella piscinae TaxID=2748098 RepID=A0A7L5BVI9_9RHOB|nr:adenylate/guanylate cyclase domain-containing protein [Pikeienuella piscinae]QIE56380.1 CHASE2 domain-containing protein [Pikeienuella piscinae]